jgi:gas vesicle protein
MTTNQPESTYSGYGTGDGGYRDPELGRSADYRSDDPEAIRRSIERTRSELSRDVNALGEAVTPGHMARRGAENVRGKAVGLKDRIMGTASDVAHSASDRTSDMASTVGDTAHDAKYAVRRQATGTPLAAGFVALGIGWLVGSLLPASEKEQELAQTVKEKAAPLVDEVKSTGQQVAQESAQNLKEPAREAVESVKDQAAVAAQNVKEEGRQAAQDVRDSAAESTDNVRREAQ